MHITCSCVKWTSKEVIFFLKTTSKQRKQFLELRSFKLEHSEKQRKQFLELRTFRKAT